MNFSKFFTQFKLFALKVTDYLVVHRMKSKRILMLIVALLIIFTKPKIESDTFFEWLFDWVGYTLILLCCLGRVFASVFICGRKNDELSTQGLFSVVRNPLYVFSFFGVLGIALLTGYVTLIVLFVGLFFLYYPAVVKSEEKFLRKKFGKTYEEYQRRVPRWFPRHWKVELPETMIVYPRLLLQTILDSALFFLVFPVMEGVELLHKTGALPTLFSLY